MSGIIRHFLAFTRPAARVLAPASTATLLQHIAALVEPQAKTPGIRFRVDPAYGRVLMVDTDQLTQPLLNRLQNALDATPEGGPVESTGWMEDDRYVIAVRDGRQGILVEARRMVFDLCYTTKTDWTGMGLPVGHRIVVAHGGLLELQNAEGWGTVALIRLPLAGGSTPDGSESGFS